MTAINDLLQQAHQRLANAHKQLPEAVSADLLNNIQLAIDALTDQQSGAFEQAHDVISQLANYHPQLVPAIERELFWRLGGDCLHFLTDEEIEQFQRSDEQ